MRGNDITPSPQRWSHIFYYGLLYVKNEILTPLLDNRLPDLNHKSGYGPVFRPILSSSANALELKLMRCYQTIKNTFLQFEEPKLENYLQTAKCDRVTGLGAILRCSKLSRSGLSGSARPLTSLSHILDGEGDFSEL